MEASGMAENQVVDPEIRAYIYSLVTALGGSGASETGKYVLGDDALAVLRDIKKWLKFYDERTNRMDVARCLAESELAIRDLIPILAQWGEEAQSNKHLSRITLACLELLVPLTWPIEWHDQMTVNHGRHAPYLLQSQVLYKRGILSNDSAPILRAIIRIALPSFTTKASDRSSRDEGILKLMLYLFRNLAVISPEAVEDEASRSSTITAFQEQDASALLLTMCSNVAEEFPQQDVVLLETLFHLVKGVNPKDVFRDDGKRAERQTSELKDLLKQEEAVNRSYAKNAPTRHGRFGTMIWVKRDEAKYSTVSGQDVLKDGRTTLLKMDESKKWNRPRGKLARPDASINNFTKPCKLNPLATKHLRTFAEEFLDSGFNPLFMHVQKAMEREAERVTETTPCHFFYLISWFLEAEALRRERQRKAHEQVNGSTWRQIEPDSFALVAGVLTQETFIILNRYMRESLDNKEWRDLNAMMRCFTQILHTVQQMAQSPLEEDQEIAENIQNRIFYEEETHERVLKILREYKDQGFSYLDACTDLSFTFLRMLEHYSKNNGQMQVRSRRARRKKKKQQAATMNESHDGENGLPPDLDSGEEEEAEARALAVERSFDFKRYAARFCTQKSVDTFITFLSYYRELNPEQLKRAHRFLYRVAFKQDLAVLLFRVDIISLFYKIIKGPQGLDTSHPSFPEYEELVRHVLRKMIKKLKERPELFVEMLFSKINSTLYFLEYGHKKPTITSQPREAAEFEVKPGIAADLPMSLGIVVSALLMDDKRDLVEWVEKSLQSAVNERKSWELEAEARAEEEDSANPKRPPSITVVPNNETCRLAMIKNGHFRLFLSLVGMDRITSDEEEDAPWIIPSSLGSANLDESLQAVQKYLQEPMKEVDGRDPREQIRRKKKDARDCPTYDPSYHIDFGDQSEGVDDIDDEILFPANPRSRSNKSAQNKPSRRKRRDAGTELSDEAAEQRRLRRQAAALERQRRIKSDLYIHASDEDSDSEADEEFFAREEARRKQQAANVKRAALFADGDETSSNVRGKKTTRRRKRQVQSSDDEDEDMSDQESDGGVVQNTSKRQRAETHATTADDSDDEMLDAEPDLPAPGTERQRTPSTTGNDLAGFSQPFQPSSPANPFAWSTDALAHSELSVAKNDGTGLSAAEHRESNEEDEDDAPIQAPQRRPRTMAGFVIDSDSE